MSWDSLDECARPQRAQHVDILLRQIFPPVECAGVPVLQREPCLRQEGNLVVGMQVRQRGLPFFWRKAQAHPAPQR
jgi:hypothetical protein